MGGLFFNCCSSALGMQHSMTPELIHKQQLGLAERLLPFASTVCSNHCHLSCLPLLLAPDGSKEAGSTLQLSGCHGLHIFLKLPHLYRHLS